MKTSIAVLLACIASFATGFVTHRWLPEPSRVDGSDEHAEQHAAVDGAPSDNHGEQQHEDHIVLSNEAAENLGLLVAPLTRSTYQRVIRIPGEVVEQPGHSAHIVAAPVNGIVTRALALPGMAISPGDPLFELQVVDEPIFKAQLELLNNVTRTEIVEAEINRLAPLAESGTVARRQVLDLRYERQQLEAQRDLRVQELLARGLGRQEVDRLTRTKDLLRSIVVYAPGGEHTADHGLGQITPAQFQDRIDARSSDEVHNDGPDSQQWTFTIERLLIAPGQTVSRGEGMCDLAHHAELYVQGQVFENEVDTVLQARRLGWPLAVEFGVGEQKIRREGLQVRYASNHVDATTQTYLFYAPLRNEVLDDSFDTAGKRFRSWRFKVGQRLQILAPIERYEDCLKLPADAVVQDGLDYYVFRRLEDEHDHELHEHDEHEVHGESEDDSDHDEAEPYAQAERDHEEHADEATLELEPVAVAIRYRDQDFVALSDEGQIRAGDEIAMNAAYQLMLAFKSLSESGGGHQHHHDH